MAYLDKIKDLLAQLKKYNIQQIPREQNATADALARLASSAMVDKASLVPIEYLVEPRVNLLEPVFMIENTHSWMTPIAAYLEHGILLNSRNDSRKLMRKSARYVILDGHGIPKSFSAILYPQANGQIEAVNKTVKDTLKKHLEEAKRNWPRKLPEVLWSYKTTERTTTGDTPFALAYGYEAILPVEVTPPSHRHTTYDSDCNHQLLVESLDYIEERHKKSNITQQKRLQSTSLPELRNKILMWVI
ncbi:uncharacterized protein LOC133806452 [Humulus lupulus]|uniref:uncharacterized protein LOC133806452 n=1 Tax=Humulus lupulus TaxID=3486 RepID=UPI002B415952|nr:uncharacterized protein LOC133806452 [Humulus lupulus]